MNGDTSQQKRKTLPEFANNGAHDVVTLLETGNEDIDEVLKDAREKYMKMFELGLSKKDQLSLNKRYNELIDEAKHLAADKKITYEKIDGLRFTHNFIINSYEFNFPTNK